MKLDNELVDKLRAMLPSAVGYAHDYFDVQVPEELGGVEGDVVTFKKRTWQTSNDMIRYDWEFFQSSDGAYPASEEDRRNYTVWKADQAIQSSIKNAMERGRKKK